MRRMGGVGTKNGRHFSYRLIHRITSPKPGQHRIHFSVWIP